MFAQRNAKLELDTHNQVEINPNWRKPFIFRNIVITSLSTTKEKLIPFFQKPISIEYLTKSYEEK